MQKVLDFLHKRCIIINIKCLQINFYKIGGIKLWLKKKSKK